MKTALSTMTTLFRMFAIARAFQPSHPSYAHTPASLGLIAAVSNVLWPQGFAAGASSIHSIELYDRSYYEDVIFVDNHTAISIGTTSDFADSAAGKPQAALISTWPQAGKVHSWTLGNLSHNLTYSSVGYTIVDAPDQGFIIGGSLYKTGSINYMPFIAKASSNNTTIEWINTFTNRNGASPSHSASREIYALKILPDHTIIAVGRYDQSGLLIRLNPDGSILSTKLFGRSSDLHAIINAFSISKSGDLVIGGETDNNAFVAELNSTNLQPLWYETFGYLYKDHVSAIATTPLGEIVTAGQYEINSDGEMRGFVVQWDSTKNMAWARALDLSLQGFTLLIDPVDSSIIVGGGPSPVNGYGLQLARIRKSGEVDWIRALNDAFGSSGVKGTTLDPSNRYIYVVGSSSFKDKPHEKGLLGVLPLDGVTSNCRAWKHLENSNIVEANFSLMPSDMKSEDWDVILTPWTNLTLHPVNVTIQDKCLNNHAQTPSSIQKNQPPKPTVLEWLLIGGASLVILVAGAAIAVAIYYRNDRDFWKNGKKIIAQVVNSAHARNTAAVATARNSVIPLAVDQGRKDSSIPSVEAEVDDASPLLPQNKRRVRTPSRITPDSSSGPSSPPSGSIPGFVNPVTLPLPIVGASSHSGSSPRPKTNSSPASQPYSEPPSYSSQGHSQTNTDL